MIRILTVVFLLIGAQAARAGILIEPYIGYTSGTQTLETKTSPSSVFDTKMSGAAFGGRLGFKMLGLWVAGDYLSMSIPMAINKPTGLKDGTSALNMAFVDVGYDFPVLVRVFAGYGVSNSMKNTYTANSIDYEDKLTGGSTTKFGIGIKAMMFFSVNLEYIKPNFKTFEENNKTAGVNSTPATDVSTLFKTSDFAYTQLTLSFPFNLL